MILPTTSAAALLLLLASFVCLGSWIVAFKLTGKWRFELFYIDFAIGAVLLSILAAFTFGVLGSDLGFMDRMLVAGRTAQALVVLSGFVFNLGNMLLVAAVPLIGISAAFPLGLGVALLAGSLFYFPGTNAVFIVSGMVLVLLAVILEGISCRLRDSVPAASSKGNTAPKGASKARARKTNKGLILAAMGGIALGLFYPVAARGLSGDFGVGPYAGMLLFSVGVLVSTVIFNFYFLNIAIEGEPLTLGAYARGKRRQHLIGLVGGALWAAGMLTAALARSLPTQPERNVVLGLVLPLASALLVILWGAVVWKEFAGAPSSAKLSMGLAAALFAGALVVTGLGILP